MNVGFDLHERSTEQVRDLLIALVLEVKQDERHPLLRRQPAERARKPCLLVGRLEIVRVRRGHAERSLKEPRLMEPRTFRSGDSLVTAHLAEKPPPKPIARQVIETEIGRYGFQPAGRRRTRSDLLEALERAQ